MTAGSKQTLKDYFKAVNIDSIEFETKDFPYTRLQYVKAFVSMFNHMEETNMWHKMKAFYPFQDAPVDKRDINVFDPNGPRLEFGEGWQTSLNLSKSDENQLKDFVKQASDNLTRKID